MMPRLWKRSPRWRLTTSELPQQVVQLDELDVLIRAARSGVGLKVQAMTFMPIALPSAAIRAPIGPAPMTPSVLPFR